MGNKLTSYARPELSKEFVEHVYRSNNKNVTKVECKKVEVTEGSEKGDNFIGEIKKIVATVAVDGKEDRKIQWIAKMMPDHGERIFFTRNANIFVKEVCVYKDYLIRMECFERAFRVTECETSSDVPKHCSVLYASSEADKEVIVMEDLRRSNFVDSSLKKKGFDLDHCLLVAEWLAKYHAVGYAFINKFPGGVDKCLESLDYLEDNFVMNPPECIAQEMTGMLEMMHDGALDQIKTAQEQGQDFYERLKNLREENEMYIQYIQRVTKPSQSLNVICHGDPWFNNMFFRYEEEKPVEVILFDLQVTRYCNPGVDLGYFFYSSVGTQERKDYLEQYLQHYHRTFMRILKMYGFEEDTYPYEQLKKDYRQYCIWGILFAVQILPTILVDKKDTLDMDKYKGASEEMMQQFMVEEQERVRRLLKDNLHLRERVFGILEQAKEEGII